MRLDGYDLVHWSGSSRLNAANGQLCFVKRQQTHENNLHLNTFKLLAHNACDQQARLYNGNNVVELSLYSIEINSKLVYMCLIYKHPTVSKSEFHKQLCTFLADNLNNGQLPLTQNMCKNLILFGDFNIDYNIQTYYSLERNLPLVQPCILDTSTYVKKTSLTDGSALLTTSQLDWCFASNSNDNIDAIVYETWFSDHQPLWITYK